MSDQPIIFVVDDDEAVRDSLRMMMKAAGFAVVTFPCASDFLDACTTGTQGCLILDVNMPNMDGPALQDELIQRGLRIPIIFLTGQGTIPLTVRTMKAGAMNFLTKPVDRLTLLTSVREALALNSRLQQQAKDSQSSIAQLAKLTEREREVMMLAIAGYSCKEIAQQLNLSYRTVENHRSHVMQKTGASNMVELARNAMPQTPQ